MNKNYTLKIFLFTLFGLMPSFTAFGMPIFYDYVGNIGQLGGTYSGFIQFNAPAPASFTFSDIVDSQINYANSNLSLTGSWSHNDLISGNGTITGSLVEQFDLDWCCSSGDTNTSAGSTPIWAVSIGPFAGGTFITDVGTGGWVLREEIDPTPEPCSPFPGGEQTGGCFPGPGEFPVPESSTMLLFGSGLAGLAAWRHCQRRNA